MTTVALIDDHKIFGESLAGLINDSEDFKVIWIAQNGKQALEHFQKDKKAPQIVLLDISMPEMDGVEVAKWIFENKKEIKVVALTMEEDDNKVIQMLQFGIKGYLLKNSGSEELFRALEEVVKFGYYYTPIVSGNIHKHIQQKFVNSQIPDLSTREKEILQFLCTELSYSEISGKIFLSESTIDTYRARLFEKFEVKNRIGLIIKAVHLGLVQL